MASQGIAAIYVSSTQFEVPADMESEFCVYRRIKANCGIDGYAYGCISSSEYSSSTGKTTVTLYESVLTSNLATVWFGVVAGGESGALPDDYILNLFPSDITVIDDGGNVRGEKALCLQTGRTDDANVASGVKSVAIGYDSKSTVIGSVAIGNKSVAGQYAVSIGYESSSKYFGCVAIGKDASSDEEQGIAIGDSATAKVRCIAIGSQSTTASVYSSIAIGRGATSPGNGAVALGTQCASAGYASCAIGYGTTASGSDSTAIGKGSSASYASAVAIGKSSSSSHYATIAIGSSATASNSFSLSIGANSESSGQQSVAVGYKSVSSASNSSSIGCKAKHLVENSICIAGCIITRNTSNSSGTDEFLDYSSAEITFMTDVLDLTTTATTEITLPTGGTFYPDEVGVIVVEADTVTVQPGMQYGTDATNIATLLAETATVGLDAEYDRHRFEDLLSDDGIQSVAVRNNTPATATTLTARIYWKGMWVEDE